VTNTPHSSLRAKLEIAHTHFAAGDYKAAAELYSRLKLVKMTEAEASEVAFRSAYISYLFGQYTNSLTGAEGFLASLPCQPPHPKPNTSECNPSALSAAKKRP
jgi:outer membrane protein assembly factor BamD (BamD/ComL family)